MPDNVVYQDNQSSIVLAQNGHASCGHRVHHIGILYFFVHNHVKQGKLQNEYCPTKYRLANFFTKPLQGTSLRQLHHIVLNLPPDTQWIVSTVDCCLFCLPCCQACCSSSSKLCFLKRKIACCYGYCQCLLCCFTHTTATTSATAVAMID